MSESWKPQAGQVVEGKFRLLELLGQSDHSAVFLTERSEEPKKAVIKLVPAVDAENQLLHWKLDTKLPHPHLLRIFESGKCESNGHELLYVVMEYAEEDLSQVLPHRPLTTSEARDMLLPTLDALSYLHGKGFVHGHIKPANILAVSDQLKLSSDSISAIKEGVVVGSDTQGHYDPPEIKEGKVSPATDAWALGMTLTEILTLHRPTYDAAKKQEPTLPKLEAPFADIVKGCLQLDPANRLTMAEIKTRLDEKLTQPKPLIEKPVQPKAQTGNSSKLLYAVPAVALVAVLASALWPKGNSPASSTSETPSTAVEKPKPALSVPASAARTAPSQPATKAALHATGGSVLQRVLPQVSDSARRTITGKIRVQVKVSVDETGNVAEAHLDKAGPSKYFARLSQQAAEQWKFEPAQANGQPSASQWLLHFVFTSNGTNATSQQIRH